MNRVAPQEVTFNIATSTETGDGKAIKDTDYRDPTPLTGTIAIGGDEATISIPILSDNIFEGNETFTLTLSGLTNALLSDGGSTLTQEITIIDDDVPTLTIADAGADEGSIISFTPTLSGPAVDDVVITYYTTSGGSTPASADDYTVVPEADLANSITASQITIPTGETTPTSPATINITTSQDEIPEPAETFILMFSATNATVMDNTAIGTIRNDDGAGLSIADVSMAEGADGASTDITFTVSVISPSSSEITYDWATSEDSGDNAATAGTDYMTSSGTDVRIPANTATSTFTVSIQGDDIPEFDETFVVRLSDPTGAKLVKASAKGIISNDDGTGLRILAASLLEGNTGATDNNMIFTVETVPPSSNLITFDWTTSILAGDTATALVDYSTTTGDDVEIPANATEVMISVPIIGDETAEIDEIFTVTLSGLSGASLLVASAKGTITNDDGSGLSIAAASIAEGANGAMTDMVFTVSVIPPSSNPITFDWATSDDSGDNAATAGTDYMATTGEDIEIPANDPSIMIRVPIIDDNTPEFDETFIVTLSDPTGASLLVASAKGTITNDDGSLLTIESEMLAEGDAGETPKMQFTVTATPPATTEFMVDWATSVVVGTDDAVADTDFSTASDTLTFAATDVTQTFEIDIIGDDTPEFDETFTVTLSNATSGATISESKGTAQGMITNDDGTGLRILAASLPEGDAGATNNNMMFTVETVPPSTSPITFDWTTSDDSGDNAATAGTDYTATTRDDVEIPANAPSIMIEVPIIGDDIAELDETFTVTLSDESGASLLVASAKGTIINDDGSELSVASIAMDEGDDGDRNKLLFTVTAEPAADRQFTVDWATSIEVGEDEAIADTDFVSASGDLTFAVGDSMKTFEVVITGDDTPEFDETFTVTLSNPGLGSYTSTTNGSAKGTITNDDGSGLRIMASSVDEGAEGETPNMNFTVSVIPPRTDPIPYTWTAEKATGDTADENVDFTASEDNPETILGNAPSDTISVPIIGDNTSEYDETFTVTLSIPPTTTGVSLLEASAKGRIVNDDGTTLTITSAEIAEGSVSAPSMMTFTVTATPPAASGFTATWTTSITDDDSASADDFTAGTDTVNIAADATTGTFTVDITGDDTPEEDETFTVTLSNPSSGARISADMGSAQGTITNDDGFGLSITDASVEEGNTDPVNMVFTVTLIPENKTNDITFKWAAAAGDVVDAVAGEDFTATTGNDGTITSR